MKFMICELLIGEKLNYFLKSSYHIKNNMKFITFVFEFCIHVPNNDFKLNSKINGKTFVKSLDC